MIEGKDYVGNCVVYFCHDGNGEFIMGKRTQNCRDDKGVWDIGGGALDFEETVKDALIREIEQEYKTNVLAYQFLGYRDVHRKVKGEPTHWIALDFKVLVDREKVGNGEPKKFEEVKWFTFDTLPKQTHSQLSIFLKKYSKKLQKDKL